MSEGGCVWRKCVEFAAGELYMIVYLCFVVFIHQVVTDGDDNLTDGEYDCVHQGVMGKMVHYINL